VQAIFKPTQYSEHVKKTVHLLVGSKRFTLYHLTTHTPKQDLNRICGHILPTIRFYRKELLLYLIVLF